MAFLRARFAEEGPPAEWKRRMLDDLYPECQSSDSAIGSEWGSYPDTADVLLDLLALQYVRHPECRYDWVAPSDRLPERCLHEDAYEAILRGETVAQNYCPDCKKAWPL